MRDLDDATAAIVDFSLHSRCDLDPGLLESVYEAVLARAPVRRRFRIERRKAMCCEYDGMAFEKGYRADLVVDDLVPVELRSVEHLARAHAKRLATCRKLSNGPFGLLIAELRHGGNGCVES